MRKAVLIALVALFAPEVSPAAAAPELAGTSWVLASAGKRAPMIRFETDGNVGGFSGCNRFLGSYKQSGEDLILSAMAATRMACPGNAMAVEQSFLDMLKKVAAARTEGGKLVLLDGAGNQIARLSKK